MDKEQYIQQIVKERLRDKMSAISEKYYCAGWLMGLEYSLWKMVIDPSENNRDFGMGVVTWEEVEELKLLSEITQGWWYWSEDTGKTFIELDNWKEKYAKR